MIPQATAIISAHQQPQQQALSPAHGLDRPASASGLRSLAASDFLLVPFSSSMGAPAATSVAAEHQWRPPLDGGLLSGGWYLAAAFSVVAENSAASFSTAACLAAALSAPSHPWRRAFRNQRIADLPSYPPPQTAPPCRVPRTRSSRTALPQQRGTSRLLRIIL